MASNATGIVPMKQRWRHISSIYNNNHDEAGNVITVRKQSTCRANTTITFNFFMCTVFGIIKYLKYYRLNNKTRLSVCTAVGV